jgi:hypothetical protein
LRIAEGMTRISGSISNFNTMDPELQSLVVDMSVMQTPDLRHTGGGRGITNIQGMLDDDDSTITG